MKERREKALLRSLELISVCAKYTIGMSVVQHVTSSLVFLSGNSYFAWILTAEDVVFHLGQCGARRFAYPTAAARSLITC